MTKKSWTSISLTKKQICYLDKLSKDCKFSRGRKLSRTTIIRSLIIAFKEIEIDVNEIKSERELSQRLFESFEEF